MAKTMQKTKVKISGMTCGGCAMGIERSLKKEDGIGEVSVNFGSESLEVDYDRGKLDFAGFGRSFKKVRELCISEEEEGVSGGGGYVFGLAGFGG